MPKHLQIEKSPPVFNLEGIRFILYSVFVLWMSVPYSLMNAAATFAATGVIRLVLVSSS